jgi:hypothetical protein
MDALTKQDSCPACGFVLPFEPWSGESPSDEICPCCGIQFGYDDAAGGDRQRRGELYQRWRKDWLAAGMPWRSIGQPPPPSWNPAEQLKRLGG